MSKFLLLFVAILLAQASPTVRPNRADVILQPITEANAHRLTEVQMLGRGEIHAFVWSPDGSDLAVLGPNGVWIYDANHWAAPPYLLGETAYYASAGEFDPTGHLLATTDRDGWRLWDIRTNRLRRVVRQTRPFSTSTLNFSPNGQIVATTGNAWASETIIQLWDVHTGRELAYLEVRNAYRVIRSLQFSPDGSEIIVIPVYPDIVHRYEVSALLAQRGSAGQAYAIEERAEVYEAAFAETGEAYFLLLAYLPDDQRQYILKSETGPEPAVATAAGDWYRITTVAFDPDVDLLVASGDLGDIEVYRIRTGELIRVLPGHEQTHAVTIDPNGEQIVSYGDDYVLKAWNVETGAGQLISDQHIRFGYVVAFHPNSEQLALGTQIADGQILFWDISTGRVIERLPGLADGGWTTDIAFQADGLRMATTWGLGCCLTVWDLHKRNSYEEFAGHETAFLESGINHVFFAQDDSMLVSSGNDATVRIWDIQSGETLSVLQHEHQKVVASALGSENLYLFSITEPYSEIWVWDIETQKEVAGVSRQYYADHLIISEDRSTLATIRTGIITLWQPNSPEPIRQINISSIAPAIVDAVFSPDKTLLAVVSHYGKLQIVSLSSGAIVAEIQTIDAWNITSIDWSSDGQLIAITGRAGSIHIYGIPVDT